MFKFVNKKKSKSFPRPKFAREKFPSADFPTLRTPFSRSRGQVQATLSSLQDT